jgi:NitT/TauT family transport system permease protein
MKKMYAYVRGNGHALLTLVVLLVVWEAAVRAFQVREFLLPAPSLILSKLEGQTGYLLKQSLSTLQTTLLGFIVAVVLGVVAAIGIVTVLGLRSTEQDMLDMARVNHASRAKVLWKIRFPNALPHMFAGMKVGISFALVGTIVGEFVAGESGLGHVILVAQGSFDTATVFVALLLLCVLGVLAFKAIELLEARFLHWHASQRDKAALHGTGPH